MAAMESEIYFPFRFLVMVLLSKDGCLPAYQIWMRYFNPRLR